MPQTCDHPSHSILCNIHKLSFDVAFFSWPLSPIQESISYVETQKIYMCFYNILHFVLFFILIWLSYYHQMFLYWYFPFTFCNILQSCAFHMIISCSIVKCFCVVIHVYAFTQFMYFLCFMVCIICFNNFFGVFIYVNSWLCLHLCLTSCCCATCFMLLCNLCYVCYL